jgi:hypothetical protein
MILIPETVPDEICAAPVNLEVRGMQACIRGLLAAGSLSRIRAFQTSKNRCDALLCRRKPIGDLQPTAIEESNDQHNQGKGRPFMASAAVRRIKKKLPERLAEVRGDRSQRQFARDLGVFQQNVNRYENGTTPHTDFLITLSTKENVSLDWLLLGKGRMRRGR